jgi:predicted transcriptional regulator
LICVDLRCTGRHSTSHGDHGVALCPRARRRKTAADRRSKRIKRGFTDAILDELENEVKVVAGRCVSWNCYKPASEGPECSEHAAEPLPVIPRASRAAANRKRRLEDPEWAEQQRKRKRGAKRNAAVENERKRAKTREARIAAGFDPDVNLATAKKQKRHADMLALLRERGFVSVAELAEQFGMHPNRVGDDLRQLDEEGLVERAYGGARLASESTSNLKAAS